jgi:outer membrane protein assembly factor BamA
MKSILTVFFILTSLTTSFSQHEKIKLLIQITDEDKKAAKLLNYQSSFRDSLSVVKELQKVIFGFQNASYILASFDSIKTRTDTIVAYLNPSYPFKWAELRSGNVNENILNKIGYREKFYRNSNFSYKEYRKLSEGFLKYSENHGYPFANIKLDSIEIINEQRISAALNYTPGPLITFDSLQVIGKIKIKKKFLISYLRLFPNQPFSQEKINNISRLLKELNYLKQTRPYTIIFSNNRAIVQLYLEERKSNQIDGIVGFLPNQTSQKKLLVTGEVNLKLKNLFGTGKGLTGEWRKYNQASQLLNISYLHPRLLSSNLDFKFDFNLLKQDSTFINIDRRLTVFQKAGRSGTLNFLGSYKSSRQLLSSPLLDKNNQPQFSDYDLYSYVIGYDRNNLDDVFFPHKGWLSSVQVTGGNKVIHKSPYLVDSLYNKINLNSVQLNFNILIERFNPIGRRSVFYGRINAGKIINKKENIFYNDLYRIGGLKTLRGFVENNFYASSFAIATVEYRFYTEESSYLLLFYDQGVINNIISASTKIDYPSGFGAGISFSTGAGIFNFIYSLGRSNSQKISLNQSKIHFGIVTRF